MSFQANIPFINNVTISPEIVAVNDKITISASVSEVLATLEYVFPYSEEIYSEEDVWPWP